MVILEMNHSEVLQKKKVRNFSKIKIQVVFYTIYKTSQMSASEGKMGVAA